MESELLLTAAPLQDPITLEPLAGEPSTACAFICSTSFAALDMLVCCLSQSVYPCPPLLRHFVAPFVSLSPFSLCPSVSLSLFRYICLCPSLAIPVYVENPSDLPCPPFELFLPDVADQSTEAAAKRTRHLFDGQVQPRASLCLHRSWLVAMQSRWRKLCVLNSFLHRPASYHSCRAFGEGGR